MFGLRKRKLVPEAGFEHTEWEFQGDVGFRVLVVNSKIRHRAQTKEPCSTLVVTPSPSGGGPPPIV